MKNSIKELTLLRDWKKHLLVALALLGVGVFFGFIISQNFFSSNTNKNVPDIELREKNSQYPYIGVLLDSETGNKTKSARYQEIEDNVKKYIMNAQEKGMVSEAAIYVRDLSNGPWFGINQDMDFSPASLFKLPVALAIFKKADSDPTILSRVLQISSRDEKDEMQINKPSITVKNGESKTVSELIQYMLMYSDNNSYMTLISELKNEIPFEKTYSDLGIVYKMNEVNDVVISM